MTKIILTLLAIMTGMTMIIFSSTVTAHAQVRDSTPDGIGVSNRSKSFSNRAPNAFESRNATNQDDRYVTRLTEASLRVFLQEIQNIATGKRSDIMDGNIVEYMNNHIASTAQFESDMTYDIPGHPKQNITLTLGKSEYIDSVLKGLYTLRDYETDMTIQDIKISSDGRHAEFVSMTDEQGIMPFPKDKNNPDDVEMLPIKGASRCHQVVTISQNNYIQLNGAQCRTHISFDPFAGQPLITDW